MAKYRSCYDNGQYNRIIYGRKANTYEGGNTHYGVCPAGVEVRRQIGHTFIYRVQTGNGYAGSINRKKYQHKYKYFVPSSINNPESDSSRNKFSLAVQTWQGLSEAQKNLWRAKEKDIPFMSGYNIFIRHFMTSKYIAVYGVPLFGEVTFSQGV